MKGVARACEVAGHGGGEKIIFSPRVLVIICCYAHTLEIDSQCLFGITSIADHESMTLYMYVIVVFDGMRTCRF